MFEQPDSVVEQAFLDDLYAIYPEARGIVSETILLKLPRMLPYAAPGRSACSRRWSGRSDASGSPATTWAASTPTRRSPAGRRRHWPCGLPCRPPNPQPEEAHVRSRFNNVVNARDVPPDDHSEPSGRYQVGMREIAEATGARDLGYSVSSIPPERARFRSTSTTARRRRSTCSKAGGSCARATARARTS